MKKFVFGKFGIDSNLFDIEIMYKVKTIVLLNHYTLMDVAYIYTWKRDTPMRFYFRVKKTRGFSKKLALKKLLLQKQKQEIVESTTATVELVTNTEKVEVKLPEPVKQSPPPSAVANIKCDSKPPTIIRPPEAKVKEVKSVENKPAKKVNQLEIDVYDYDASQHNNFEIIPSPKFKRNSSNFSDDLKMKLVNKSKNKHNGVKFLGSPLHGFSTPDPPASSPITTNKKEPKSSKKSSPSTKAIKMKFDLSKQNSVTIINMSDPERKEIVKPIKPEKKNKTNKLLTVPPLTIKKSGAHHNTLTTSSSKSNSKPLVSENPDVIKLIPQKDFEERKEDVKSDFLESFSLTPISSLNSTTASTPEKEKDKNKNKDSSGKNNGGNGITSSSNNTSSKNNDTTFAKPMALLFGSSSKRKSKDPIKELPSPTFKKPKLDLNKMAVDVALRPIKPAKKVDISKLSLNRNKKEEMKTIKLGPIDEALKAIQQPKKVDSPKFVAPRPTKKDDEPVIRLAPLENILKPEVKAKKSPSPPLPGPLFAPPPIKGQIAPPGSTTPHPNLGNRTPGAKRYQPILPKTPRNNPFANIPNDVNRILQGAGTEIKSISSKESGTKIYGPSSSSTSGMGPPPPPSRPTQPKGQSSISNYLNMALYNSSKSKGNEAPPGCRTPMYSPSSPIYSPNSPSYAPNYNIPIRKYTPTTTPSIKPSSNLPSSPNSSNILQNMLSRQTKQFDSLFPSAPKKSSTPSPPPSEQQKTTAENNKSNKRPFPGSTSPSSSSTTTAASPSSSGASNSGEPPEKQIKVKSLLNSCNINIPSSLSITITNDDAESKSPNAAASKHKSPVNNYIEILKLPDKNEEKAKPVSLPPAPIKPIPVMNNGKVSPPKAIDIKVEKKTPSPEKKSHSKKSPDTKKSPQEVTAVKKFRHILPRTTTPPKTTANFVQPSPVTTNQTDTPKMSPTQPPLIPTPQQQMANIHNNFFEMMAARNMFFPQNVFQQQNLATAAAAAGIMNYQQAFLNYAKQKEKEQAKMQIQSPMHFQQVLFEQLAKNWSTQEEALQYLKNLGTSSALQGPLPSGPGKSPASDKKTSNKSSPTIDSKKSMASSSTK